jgi:hydroxyquinol 1,2-dioxygenase
MSQETTDGRREFPLFTEAASADVVNARMGPEVDPRLRQVMAILVKHLHEAVKEIAPTHEEWLAGIEFLSEVGRMCTEWRQEFILLSDTLGVSSLVDAINHRRPTGATSNTILGPFHVPDAPRCENGANICRDGKGEPLVVRGRVLNTNGAIVPGALIDIWQTNDDGFYDVQQKGVQPDWNLRGVFAADVEGRYWLRSAKPRYYPIPGDGPVGKMLAALGRNPNRAAHIHFIVTAPGFDPVITHLFAPDCAYLAEDAVFGVKNDLIGDFRMIEDTAQAARFGVPAPFWLVDWDFVLTRAST